VKPRQVLVLGAGGGNDVAAAVRNGATSVAAVEIDPVIASLGRLLHPEKPYDAPQVRLVVDDARNFLERARDRYDLIVFGLVDSHTVVAAMSNIRLDSFLYTRESFARARDLLTPDGMIALSFSSGYGESYWLLRRIAYMLEYTFGTPPVILEVGYDGGFVFLAGPQAPRQLTDPVDRGRAESAQSRFQGHLGGVASEPATDDWPFMYLRGRFIPTEYWIIGAVVFVFALAMVWRLVPGGLAAVDGHFFCLGAAFLLLEVRNLAELSLLFGSTWMVNAFVIAGVLVMAFVANVVAGRFRVPETAVFAALALSVALSFFSPVTYLAGMDPWVRMLLGTAILSLPFFFSGLVFSTSFKATASPAVAYGSNLLGAVGGLLEQGSLAHGIRSLSLLALVIYALAYLLLQRRRAQDAKVAPVPA
jgi:spermine/spermidine synthase